MVNSTLSGETMLALSIEFGLPREIAFPSPMSPPSPLLIEKERQHANLCRALLRSKGAVILLERALSRMTLSRLPDQLYMPGSNDEGLL